MADIKEPGKYWWKLSKSDSADAVFEKIKYLKDYQPQQEDILQWVQMYGNLSVMGLSPSTYNETVDGPKKRGPTHRLTLNIIQPMVDSLVNKITQSHPRIQVVTDGAKYSLKSQAKKLTKFLDGLFFQTDFYNTAIKAFHDACWAGTGVLKIFRDGDNVSVERVFPGEIRVDDCEAMYTAPRAMHQVRQVPRSQLVVQYPKHVDAIEKAEHPDDNTAVTNRFYDMIEVVESWHLPSTKDASDGVHSIDIQGANLLREEYTCEKFPFVFIRFAERPLGFWGLGISEILLNDQYELNRLLHTLQLSFKLFGVPKIFIKKGNQIISSKLNNLVGGIIEYKTDKPTFESLGTAIPVEILRMIDWIYERSIEKVGISQLSAQSKKPSGLDSSPALREFLDVEAARFFTLSKRWEEVFVQAAEHMVEIVKEIAEDNNGSFTARTVGAKFLEDIDWADIDLDDQSYLMKSFPTSFLPQQPAARKQAVQEMLQSGLWSAEDCKRLLDFPDLESVSSLENAARENIDWVIEQLIDNGTYVAPESYQNLDLGIQTLQKAILRAQMEGAPEENIDLARRWIKSAEALINEAKMAAAAEQAAMMPPAPGMPPNSPQAVPEAPPVSDLIPNLPAAA